MRKHAKAASKTRTSKKADTSANNDQVITNSETTARQSKSIVTNDAISQAATNPSAQAGS